MAQQTNDHARTYARTSIAFVEKNPAYKDIRWTVLMNSLLCIVCVTCVLR